ncbi:MAG: thermonuclease family protein [Phycisphaerae bacterium]
MRFEDTVNKSTVIAVGALMAITFSAYRLIEPDDRVLAMPQTRSVIVNRVISGNKFKIEPEGYVVLAGIRAPYRSEPLGDQAFQALGELVEHEQPRLRFPGRQKDDRGRWNAYVFVDGGMVNERLVREGLAYVRLKAGQQRFADELLAAQSDARAAHRGLWALQVAAARRYFGDRKHGSFHRLTCQDVANIKPDDKIDLVSRDAAFDQGLAPCGHCDP